MPTSSSLESLISNGQTKAAIEQLRDLLSGLVKEHDNSLLLLSSRRNCNNETELLQTEDSEAIKIEKNRINASFLSILSEVREDIQSKISFYNPIPKQEGEKEALGHFLASVLSKKYENIKHFKHGNTFNYFKAKDKYSGLEVMIMVFKSSEAKNVSTPKVLNSIALLKHRNLVQLLEVNFQTYPFYLVTEFVMGISLKTLMQNIGPMPLQNAKRLLLIIGDVMNTLKLKKFPASTIRPSRIWIDHELEPEISAFDLLSPDEDKRLLKTFIEDCHYYPDERLYAKTNAHPKPLTPDEMDAANQFCLAALGYEMITGERLFGASDAVSDILRERHRFYTKLEYRNGKLENKHLSRRLSAIFKKMLHTDPNKRYDDLPTALHELAKVRVVLNADEEKVFKSYRRCLHNTEDFIGSFYENLFAKPGMETQKPIAGSQKNGKCVKSFT
jgi:serine/threonine protein kinase